MGGSHFGTISTICPVLLNKLEHTRTLTIDNAKQVHQQIIFFLLQGQVILISVVGFVCGLIFPRTNRIKTQILYSKVIRGQSQMGTQMSNLEFESLISSSLVGTSLLHPTTTKAALSVQVSWNAMYKTNMPILSMVDS